jgi:Sodium/hydrogen exchanger family
VRRSRDGRRPTGRRAARRCQANRLAGQAVEASHQLILLGGVLVLLSIFAGVFSARLGAPLLLVFLGLGMLAGSEGPGRILFRDFHAASLIGSIGLAIILFDGGLRTDPSDVRRALWPSLALTTIGVIGHDGNRRFRSGRGTRTITCRPCATGCGERSGGIFQGYCL